MWEDAWEFRFIDWKVIDSKEYRNVKLLVNTLSCLFPNHVYPDGLFLTRMLFFHLPPSVKLYLHLSAFATQCVDQGCNCYYFFLARAGSSS